MVKNVLHCHQSLCQGNYWLCNPHRSLSVNQDKEASDTRSGDTMLMISGLSGVNMTEKTLDKDVSGGEDSFLKKVFRKEAKEE